MKSDYHELMQTALKERDNAYRNLNYAVGAYVDVAVHQVNMAESRVNALLEEAKRMGETSC
jgi:HEPN domain-containing protein